jgi:hypothetical protein
MPGLLTWEYTTGSVIDPDGLFVLNKRMGREISECT